MDKRNSLYSSNRSTNFNTTSIYSPIAESTHIQKSTLNGKFPWGGQISPIQKCSSSANKLDRTKPSSIKISPINRSSIIDPRIYTDVRSKGLASRIVKYHDDSVKLNRSLSAGNRYNRPGQFPIVHLNKSQIQYKANRNRPASVVRIAPPDKVIFHANTRSSILRSPSVVPTVNLRKTTSELSCENRPILHPAENDLVPTRSVLDALKEISRKRINSDDLDGLDMAKKYCKDISVLHMNASNSLTSINNSYAIKRQREGQSSPNSKAINTEQVIKKRMCLPSNDITSSLSSSIHMLTPKRKLSELNAGGNNSTGNNSTSSENSISPKAKQSCNELNNREKQQLINDKSRLNIPQSSYVAINQITPLPSTLNMNDIQYHHHPLNSYQIPIENDSENSSAVYNSVPVISIPKEDVNRQHKPKLTLFNKNYDDEEFKRNFNSRKNLREQTDDDDDEVNFVKPRNASAAQFENNPIIEKMKQSRLALMLKGLRGELNDDSKDENDNEDVTDTPQKLANTTENKETTKETEPEKTTEPATTTSGASMSFATKTTDSTSIISSAIVVSPRTSLSSNQMQFSSGTSTGFNFGLKTTDSNTSPSRATNQNPSSTAATSTGFSFGLNSAANTQSGTITSASTSIITNPTTTVATMGGFAFNAPKVTSTSATTAITNANSVLSTQSPLANTTSSTPQFGHSHCGFSGYGGEEQKSSFSLLSKIGSAFAETTKPETTSAITAASKFVFGGEQTLSDKQQSTENNQISGNSSNSSVKPIFGTFSSNPQSTFSTSTTQAVTTASSATSNQISSFSFSNNQVSSNAQEKSTFGVFGLQSNKTFGNFSSSTSQPATTTTTVSTFGSISQEKSAAVSMFGSNTNKTPSFGNPAVSSTEIPKTTNLFENKSSAAAGFSFLELAASQNANNTNKESTTFSTPFAFGSASKSSTAGGFSFKNTATTTAAAATTTTNLSPSQFSFVGSGNSSGISSLNAPSTSTSEIDTTKPGFIFGAQLKGSDATKTFNFNAPSTTSTTSASFGFSFGGTSSTENKQSNFSFGAVTTAAATTTNSALSPSSFSFTKPATTSQNTFGNLNASKTFAGGFSFAPSSNTESKPTTFGTFSSTPAAAGKSQTELSSANKFSFSNVAANSNIEIKTTETPAASSSSIFSGNSQNPSFGNPPSLGQSKTFNFGSTNNTASNTSQNIFGGSTALSSGTNLFGSSGISSLGSKPASTSTFSFGSRTTNQQGTSNSTPFAFGSSSTAATPTAAASATTGGSLLTGGILSSSSLSTSDNSKPFTFGSSLTASNEQQQQQQQNSDPTKLFSFGASSSSSSSSLSAPNTNTNLFAATLNNPPSFNFSAQVNNNAAASITGNTFGGAVGTVTDRPIRKATRRLTNKTS